MALAHSPVDLEALTDELTYYLVNEDKKILLDGFNYGFRIPYQEHTDQRLLKRQEEIKLGRVAGPFNKYIYIHMQI